VRPGAPPGVFVDLGQGSWYTFADNKLVGHKLTWRALPTTLSGYTDKPVVDMTGGGQYQLRSVFSNYAGRLPDDADSRRRSGAALSPSPGSRAAGGMRRPIP